VLELANARYEGGLANSLEVIVAQQARLNSERLAAQVLGQRMLASVFLVRALGGDWEGLASTDSRPAAPAAPGESGAPPAVR
jgi:outer membrane protein TolC